MRRGFSILLILLFGFGPLSAFVDSEDANLPACCRRHGAHHCAMAMQMAAMTRDAESGKVQTLSAPMTCPLYPGTTIALATPAPALAIEPAMIRTTTKAESLVGSETVAFARLPNCTHAGRGPPTSLS